MNHTAVRADLLEGHLFEATTAQMPDSLDLLRIQQMSVVLSRGLESSAIFAPAY